MTNRNPVKQLFITFPHSTIDKNTFRDTLLRFEPDYYKVCEENHKDGTPHLHAVVRFKNKYSKTKVLAYYKELYPDDYKRIDIKPVRSIKNSIAYLSKEDESPLESGEYTDNRNPQRNAQDSLAKLFGYASAEDAIKQSIHDQAHQLLMMGKIQEELQHLTSYPNFSLPFYIQRILDRNLILKDDITILENFFKIQL